MKTAICFAILLGVTSSTFAAESVRGYVRRDGTYVAPHFRSSPNSTTIDNYSSQGNVNPYTGNAGTVNPYQAPAPRPIYQPQPMQPMQPYQPYQPPQQYRPYGQ